MLWILCYKSFITTNQGAMITVPSTPPHIHYPKMKASPSPHSVQFPQLHSDDIANVASDGMQSPFRNATKRFSQVSSPSKPPCHPSSPRRASTQAVSSWNEVLALPFPDETISEEIVDRKKNATRQFQRDVSFRTLTKRFASAKSSDSKAQSHPTSTSCLSPLMECEKKVLSENLSLQNSRQLFSSPVSKSKVYQPPVSVDTALKGKVSASKVKNLRFAMPLETCSTPTHQRRSSTGGSNASWSYSPLSGPKNELVNNKVFQKKYNTAATTIQRVLRGFFGRYQVVRILSAIQIQTMLRQRWQRIAIQKQEASVKIQRHVRGWRCRRRTIVFQLEHKLRMIEQQKEQDILDLNAWKVQEMERIRRLAQSTSKEVIQKSGKYKETLENAEKVIKHLRKENKKLRDKNDALQVAINLLLDENKILEKQALEYKIYTERMTDMVVINHENAALADLLAQFEERKVEFEQALDCRDERIMFENKVGRLYLNGIQSIVVAIGENCDDEDLVFSIEEMCVQCNIPGSGSGLEETEFSERMW